VFGKFDEFGKFGKGKPLDHFILIKYVFFTYNQLTFRKLPNSHSTILTLPKLAKLTKLTFKLAISPKFH
jgi:hypothetical protein